MKFFVKLIGSGLGSGYFPIASGTAGSLAALFIWMILPEFTPYQHVIFLSAAFFIGVPICTRMEEFYGHDPGKAVFDEFVGQWTAFFLLPKTLIILVAAFCLFRLFDIWKPFPANSAQKLPRGWGIMVDDVVAGAYACGLVHIGVVIFG